MKTKMLKLASYKERGYRVWRMINKTDGKEIAVLCYSTTARFSEKNFTISKGWTIGFTDELKFTIDKKTVKLLNKIFRIPGRFLIKRNLIYDY